MNVIEQIQRHGGFVCGQPGAGRGVDAGGGGYGSPLERDPERVLKDVLDHWETIERADSIYGVVFDGKLEDASLSVNAAATAARRAELSSA